MQVSVLSGPGLLVYESKRRKKQKQRMWKSRHGCRFVDSDFLTQRLEVYFDKVIFEWP
jgi:hypothetical protein